MVLPVGSGRRGRRGRVCGVADKRTLIIGGTGLLGHHSTVALVDGGHPVVSLSSRGVESKGSSLPGVEQRRGDVFTMTTSELAEHMVGCRSVIHSVGPDDRSVPDGSARQFFGERLGKTTGRLLEAAASAGVEQIVVFGSYFTFLDRVHPGRGLAARHPYIGARLDQLDRCREAASNALRVSVFELPYVFGTSPGREPLWNDVLVRRLNLMRPWMLYTGGGTAAASARYVGLAARAVIERGSVGPLPIAEENIDWSTLLSIASEELYGRRRRIITIPGPVAGLYGTAEELYHRSRGRQPGLRYGSYLRQVQTDHSNIPEAIIEDVARRFDLEPQSVEPAIRETFARCREIRSSAFG